MTRLKPITPIVKLDLKLQCDYNDAYILENGIISIAEKTGDSPNNYNKEVVFKTCAPVSDCISEINNTQLGNTKDIVMPMIL